MKRKGWPLWLLRDVPAFLGVLFSFWPLVIFVIRSERRAVREGKVRRSFLDMFASLLAHAEARIAFALWRQAYRRLGWNPRLVKFTLDPSTDDWDEAMARHRNYSATFKDLDAALAVYIEALRQQYSISERDLVVHGSTDAWLCRAAHHELRLGSTAPIALILSSAQSARPSKDERGYASARGPPTLLSFSKSKIAHRAAPPARSHRHARKRKGRPRGRPFLRSLNPNPRTKLPSAGQQAARPSDPARV